jgi:predicted metal-binding protein
MPQHTLFVCQSCHRSEERPDDQPADGTRLLAQLNALCTEQRQSEEFEIQPVGCLWICDKPCAAAFSASHKPTYLFTNLPTEQAAPALLQFGNLYLSSSTGDIPWKQFPATLQSVSIAKIPAVGHEWMGGWAIASAVSPSFWQLIWIKAVRSQKILKLRSPSLFGCRPFF